MSRIIQARKYVKGEIVHQRSFDWAGKTNYGYAFDCDKHGNVDVSKLNPVAQESYRKCITNSFTKTDGTSKPIVDRGVRTGQLHGYHEPAILKCDCGKHVELYGFTNTCECGADYNMSGQKLANRSQWGEAEGESLEDILSIR